MADDDVAGMVAERWMGKLSRDDFDNFLLLTRQAYSHGHRDAMCECAAICDAVAAEAWGNSAEQAGANQCAQAIRAAAQPKEINP